MYSGRSTPYSLPTSSASSHQSSGYFSSMDVHRPADDKGQPSQPQMQRQSLPSIHEALGSENSLPPTTAFGPPSKPASHQAPHSSARSPLDGPPPNRSYSSVSSSGSLLREPSFSQPSGPQYADASRSSLASVSSQGSRNASLSSPTQSAHTGITSIAGSQASIYEFGQRASASSTPSNGGYGPVSHSFSFHSQQSPQNPYFRRSYGSGSWKPESVHAAEAKRDVVGHSPLYGDSGKHHLDIYDCESPLNEVRYIVIYQKRIPMDDS